MHVQHDTTSTSSACAPPRFAVTTQETHCFFLCCRHIAKGVKAQVTYNDVRVTILRDGSTTYHFFETPEESVAVQHPSGAAQEPQAVRSNSVVAFETSPAIAAYLADRHLHSKPQQITDSTNAHPSWSRQLAQLQRGTSRHKIPTKNRPRHSRNGASLSSAPVSYMPDTYDRQRTSNLNGNLTGSLNGSSDYPASLDSSLDFEESNTELLLRAYSSRASAGRLDAALQVLEGVIKAGRIDVLRRSVI